MGCDLALFRLLSSPVRCAEVARLKKLFAHLSSQKTRSRQNLSILLPKFLISLAILAPLSCRIASMIPSTLAPEEENRKRQPASVAFPHACPCPETSLVNCQHTSCPLSPSLHLSQHKPSRNRILSLLLCLVQFRAVQSPPEVPLLSLRYALPTLPLLLDRCTHLASLNKIMDNTSLGISPKSFLHEFVQLYTDRGIGMTLRERLNVPKAGVTQTVAEKIHAAWRKSDLVRLKFHESLAHDMKTAHELVERRMGGLHH